MGTYVAHIEIFMPKYLARVPKKRGGQNWINIPRDVAVIEGYDPCDIATFSSSLLISSLLHLVYR